VEDYSMLVYEEDGSNTYPAQFLELEMEKVASGSSEVKAFVTKNENFCDAALHDRILRQFDAEQLDYGIHCHVWKNPISAEDLMFVKFFYSENAPN
jgi:hypothetical protein